MDFLYSLPFFCVKIKKFINHPVEISLQKFFFSAACLGIREKNWNYFRYCRISSNLSYRTTECLGKCINFSVFKALLAPLHRSKIDNWLKLAVPSRLLMDLGCAGVCNWPKTVITCLLGRELCARDVLIFLRSIEEILNISLNYVARYVACILNLYQFHDWSPPSIYFPARQFWFVINGQSAGFNCDLRDFRGAIRKNLTRYSDSQCATALEWDSSWNTASVGVRRQHFDEATFFDSHYLVINSRSTAQTLVTLDTREHV